MSKITEAAYALARDERVINAHDFYRPLGPVVFITYSAEQPGRGYEPAKFSISAFNASGQQVKTNPDGHWRDYGLKTFNLLGHRGTLKERRAAALAEAQAWASAKYGVQEWKRDPWGGWGEAAKVDARVAQIKAAIKAQPDDD